MRASFFNQNVFVRGSATQSTAAWDRNSSWDVRVYRPKRPPVCVSRSRRPLATALADLRFSLPPVQEKGALEAVYASANPDTVAALQKKMSRMLDFNDPDQAKRQAIKMAPYRDPDLIGASGLIAIHEAIKLLRGKLSEGNISSLFARLDSLATLHQECVPEQIISAMEVNDALGVVYYLSSSQEKLPDSAMGVPGLIISALFHPYSVGETIDDKVFDPIGKQFGGNLNHLLTFLPPRRIEIGAGRGMLSAVLNACVEESGVGRKMFFTSDKFKVSKPWPGIDRVLRLSAEKIIEKYRHSPFKEQIIYLCCSPTDEMISGIVATGEPILLLVASELYGAQILTTGLLEANVQMKIQKLAIEPSKVGGGVLLGMNMDSRTFTAISGKIPDRYKLDG